MSIANLGDHLIGFRLANSNCTSMFLLTLMSCTYGGFQKSWCYYVLLLITTNSASSRLFIPSFKRSLYMYTSQTDAGVQPSRSSTVPNQPSTVQNLLMVRKSILGTKSFIAKETPLRLTQSKWPSGFYPQGAFVPNALILHRNAKPVALN